MSKLKVIGNYFIEVEESLFNLKGFKEIEKHSFGYDENPPFSYAIRFTPISPDKDSYDKGVDGSFMMTEYTEEEKEEWEGDYSLIQNALGNNKNPVTGGNIFQPGQTRGLPDLFERVEELEKKVKNLENK